MQTNWKLSNHIIGKVYDLTQENMCAMISDIEMLKKQLISSEKEGFLKAIHALKEHNLKKLAASSITESEWLEAKLKEYY